MPWLVSVFIILLVIGLLGALLWMLGVKSQTPPKPRPFEQFPSMNYETITFPSGGGTLKGWFIPSQPKASTSPYSSSSSNPAPLIIIVHGWGSNRSRMLRYAEPLHKEGYALLMFDARGHGESDAHPTPSGLLFRDDMLAALDYACTRNDVNANRIAVLAHSLGAFGSLLALEQDPRVQAIITDSMPIRMQTIVEAELTRHKLPLFPLASLIPKIWFYRIGITKSEVNELDIPRILNQSETPVLLVHSKKDGYIPPSELEYVLAHVKPDRVEHLFVETQGHRSSETDPKFWNSVNSFLHKHLLYHTQRSI